MNPNDIHAVLTWWFVLFVFGVLFLPVTFRLFSQFFDKGYIFSRLIGLLFVGYAVFVLGTFRFAPFTNSTIIITAIILAAIFFFTLKPWWKTWFIIKNHWITFAIEELLFLTVLFTWAYVHSFAPDIHGLEKFMDFGFVNSLLRSEYFPPKDMWFTPYTINYYYFGHLLTALLTKVSGLPSYITFNLMLSTVVASCFSFTFCIGANLYYNLVEAEKIPKLKLILSGILTACLVTLAGNLHILYGFFKPYNTDNPVPMWQLPFSPLTFPNSYWYPNATRFIYHTIHEFPIYSWTVADLHGHVLDIPFVLLCIAFLFSLLLIQNATDKKTTLDQTFLIHPVYLVFIGLLLAAMYMTNAWDGAIYWLLAVMTFIVVHGQKIELYKKKLGKNEPLSIIKQNKRKSFSFPKLSAWQISWTRDIALSVLVITAGLLLFATPYNLYFDTSAYNHGIGVICAPNFLTKIGRIGPFLFEPDHCQRSYWWELLTLYGFFYFFVAAFGVFLYRTKRYAQTDVFVVLLIILSTFLIIIPEFFYLKDIYPTYYRANTMFKLVFQAFIMLQICSAYIIVRMSVLMGFVRLKQRIIIYCFLIVSAFLVCMVMMYPYLAVNAYYDGFKTYEGLDGISYLKTLYPDDYLAIMWLNQNIQGQPVILEAQGDSYTDYARISANTGLPTVLGWTVHEWLWRGSYDVPAPRITDVQTMYNSTDVLYTKALLGKYNVQYVYVGTLEYQKYPHLDQQKFGQLGHIVYKHGATTIYKLNT
jgi:YYY domain-containing protein